MWNNCSLSHHKGWAIYISSQTEWAIIWLSKPRTKLHTLCHGALYQIFQAPSPFFSGGAWIRGYVMEVIKWNGKQIHQPSISGPISCRGSNVTLMSIHPVVNILSYPCKRLLQGWAVLLYVRLHVAIQSATSLVPRPLLPEEKPGTHCLHMHVIPHVLRRFVK